MYGNFAYHWRTSGTFLKFLQISYIQLIRTNLANVIFKTIQCTHRPIRQPKKPDMDAIKRKQTANNINYIKGVWRRMLDAANKKIHK